MTSIALPLLLFAAAYDPMTATAPASAPAPGPASGAIHASLLATPVGPGAAVTVTKWLGEIWAVEGSAGKSPGDRKDLSLFGRLGPLAIGPALSMGRGTPVAFGVVEIGHVSRPVRGLSIMFGVGVQVALNDSISHCGYLEFFCAKQFRAGEGGLRSRIGLGVAF